MAATLFNASRFMRELHEAEERGEPYLWGNVMNLSEGAVEELGIKGAMEERDRLSSHLASSGESPTMPRKARKEHYTRKIAKYKEHEAECLENLAVGAFAVEFTDVPTYKGVIPAETPI